MAYTKVELQTFKPMNPNDSIEGIYIGSEAEVGANKSMIYTLEVAGQPWGVWGSVVLDGKMTTAKPGDKIKIVYLGRGDEKPGKNAPKLFDVYIDHDFRKDPATNAEVDRLMNQATQPPQTVGTFQG